jgi:hypothetical protein
MKNYEGKHQSIFWRGVVKIPICKEEQGNVTLRNKIAVT